VQYGGFPQRGSKPYSAGAVLVKLASRVGIYRHTWVLHAFVHALHAASIGTTDVVVDVSARVGLFNYSLPAIALFFCSLPALAISYFHCARWPFCTWPFGTQCNRRCAVRHISSAREQPHGQQVQCLFQQHPVSACIVTLDVARVRTCVAFR
jgi:hypothetical protein